MITFKNYLEEAIKGWKHAHNDIAKARAAGRAAADNVQLVRLKKDGNESKMHDATKTFGSEEEARAHHENMVKLNPGKGIAHNLYVNGEHKGALKEEAELDEAVADIQMIKKKKLVDRTPREQAALNAAKQSKPPQGKVEVHIKHEDGKISKNKFKLQRSQPKWEAEADEIAKGHLANLQSIYDRFPTISGSRAKEVHKVVIK